MDEAKKTLGQHSIELQKYGLDMQDPVELQRKMMEDWESKFWECVDNAKNTFPDKNFYIVSLTRRNRLMTNVFRNDFVGRFSCPTPNYDQTVWQYIAKYDEARELWSIPDPDTCKLYYQNAIHVHADEKQLLSYILDFLDGSLLKKCKELNNETDKSLMLIQH